MKQILLMIAVVALVGCGDGGKKAAARTGHEQDDVVITDPILMEVLGKKLNKPYGKLAPPQKFTEAELAELTFLDLHDIGITDAGLKEIAKLHNLTELHLDDTEITDACLGNIAKLQNLIRLKLKRTKITDACRSIMMGIRLHCWKARP